MAREKVHRPLALASPQESGPDVKALQGSINKEYKHFKVDHKIARDGDFGRQTFDAAEEVALCLGVTGSAQNKLGRKILSEGTQALIRGRRRTDEEEIAGRKRETYRKELRKRYAKEPGEQAVAKGRKLIGVKEQPEGSNWGGKVEDFIRFTGYGEAVYWCFAAGTLVNTPTGLWPIEQICDGDEVISGTGVARKVVATHSYENRDLVKLTAHGIDGTTCSTEHPYLARRRLPGGRHRQFTAPQWVKAGELKRNDLLALPKFSLPSGGNLPTEAEAYLIGRYLADGWHGKQARGVGNYAICCSHAEEDELVEAFEKAKCPARPYQRRTDSSMVLPSRFHLWLKDVGRGARNKRVPGRIMGWPADRREAVLAGYLDGDGHTRPDTGRIVANSVSRELALGVAQLARASEQIVSFRKEERAAVATIEGRTVNQAPYRYHLGIQPIAEIEAPQFVDEEQYTWVPVRSVTPAPSETVYDLTVMDEQTFIADGAVVHNCGCFACWVVVKLGGADIPSRIRLGYAPNITADALAGTNGLRAVPAKDARPGDIACLWGGEHIEVIASKPRSGSVKCLGGNTTKGGQASNGGEVAENTRSLSDFDKGIVARPNWR